MLILFTVKHQFRFVHQNPVLYLDIKSSFQIQTTKNNENNKNPLYVLCIDSKRHFVDSVIFLSLRERKAYLRFKLQKPVLNMSIKITFLIDCKKFFAKFDTKSQY